MRPANPGSAHCGERGPVWPPSKQELLRQIDDLLDRVPLATGAEKSGLTLEYLRLKEALEDADEGGTT